MACCVLVFSARHRFYVWRSGVDRQKMLGDFRESIRFFGVVEFHRFCRRIIRLFCRVDDFYDARARRFVKCAEFDGKRRDTDRNSYFFRAFDSDLVDIRQTIFAFKAENSDRQSGLDLRVDEFNFNFRRRAWRADFARLFYLYIDGNENRIL